MIEEPAKFDGLLTYRKFTLFHKFGLFVLLLDFIELHYSVEITVFRLDLKGINLSCDLIN